MDMKFRLYPYPVLWDKNDDYINSKFDSEINIIRDMKKFIIDANFILENDEIKNLIENNKAEYILHIECPSTSYREVFPLKNKGLIKISEENLLGKVSICSFILAKENINNYKNISFNPEYSNVDFSLEKGNIIAIGSSYKFTVMKDIDDLCDAPSIFTIHKKETTDDIGIEVELNNEHKISIGMNIKDYENYNQIVNSMPNMINTVNSFIIFPTLVYLFGELKNGFNEYENYRWFQAIRKMFINNTTSSLEESLGKYTPMELAQKIMNYITSKALIEIKDMNEISEEDE